MVENLKNNQFPQLHYLFSSNLFLFTLNLLFFLSFSSMSVAYENHNLIPISAKSDYKQWFTGSILTPCATTAVPGHPGLEMAVLVSKTYGFYNSNRKLTLKPTIYGISQFFDLQIGINSILGLEFIGLNTTNFCRGASSTYLDDSTFRLGFQIFTDKENSWIPDFRILFEEIFPTGNYQKFKPKKLGTDSTGQGAFQTGVQFVLQKLLFEKGNHPLRLKGSLGYFMLSPVKVKGINYYGGEQITKGIVFPGMYYTGFLFGEYALSRRWTIACEFNYTKGGAGQFLKLRGLDIIVPAFNQFCILPEIQHTYSKDIAIILGGWFTIKGKNSPAFANILLSVLIIF